MENLKSISHFERTSWRNTSHFNREHLFYVYLLFMFADLVRFGLVWF